jgi:uncharacterized protein with PIN domain
MTAVTFIFHNYLKDLLKKERRGLSSFTHHFERRASVKDVIESLGVPHPLVGRLTINGRESSFAPVLRDKDVVEISPLAAPVNPLVPTLLRPEPLGRLAFVADANVGKLALHLRSLGFDTLYGSAERDAAIAEIARSRKRILLTRDISLLKRKIISHGYLLRSHDPAAQFLEVVRLYDLAGRSKPLSRCIACNGLLVPVSKKAVLDRLEPLTRKYYQDFHTCQQCGKVYWPGSHREKLDAFIRHILQQASRPAPEVG